MVTGFEIKMMVKRIVIEIVFKSWGPIRIYQLITTANPALFKCNWAILNFFFNLQCLNITENPTGVKGL